MQVFNIVYHFLVFLIYKLNAKRFIHSLYFNLIIVIIINWQIGDDIRTIGRNADVLLKACKDTGLAVNTGKTNYMEIGRHRGIIANEHIKIGRNSYEKVKNFKGRL